MASRGISTARSRVPFAGAGQLAPSASGFGHGPGGPLRHVQHVVEPQRPGCRSLPSGKAHRPGLRGSSSATESSRATRSLRASSEAPRRDQAGQTSSEVMRWPVRKRMSLKHERPAGASCPHRFLGRPSGHPSSNGRREGGERRASGHDASGRPTGRNGGGPRAPSHHPTRSTTQPHLLEPLVESGSSSSSSRRRLLPREPSAGSEVHDPIDRVAPAAALGGLGSLKHSGGGTPAGEWTSNSGASTKRSAASEERALGHANRSRTSVPSGALGQSARKWLAPPNGYASGQTQSIVRRGPRDNASTGWHRLRPVPHGRSA